MGGFEAYLLAEEDDDGKAEAEEVYRVHVRTLNLNCAVGTILDLDLAAMPCWLRSTLPLS